MSPATRTQVTRRPRTPRTRTPKAGAIARPPPKSLPNLGSPSSRRVTTPMAATVAPARPDAAMPAQDVGDDHGRQQGCRQEQGERHVAEAVQPAGHDRRVAHQAGCLQAAAGDDVQRQPDRRDARDDTGFAEDSAGASGDLRDGRDEDREGHDECREGCVGVVPAPPREEVGEERRDGYGSAREGREPGEPEERQPSRARRWPASEGEPSADVEQQLQGNEEREEPWRDPAVDVDLAGVGEHLVASVAERAAVAGGVERCADELLRVRQADAA